jgi:predicted ATPase
LRSGWKQLEIGEEYSGKRLVTEARHINDGLLRLIAILAELQNEKYQFLLFDEIENGINPELVEFVTTALTSCRQQVMVTTHSPMILNYLEDETARNGVIYLYKTEEGYTRAIRFFSIPSIARKLTVMGPGEAFVDTNLTELPGELSTRPDGE